MKPRCDHCGKYIDVKNDIECCEMKMFEFKYLSDEGGDYTRADNGKLYYCGECKDILFVRFVKNYTNKSFKEGETKMQIKSKERVNKHGEVFTNEREVKAMCDLIPLHIWEKVDSTFLEPCCGNGNFLVEILERKLKRCDNSIELGLKALESIYGIDLLPDNVVECRIRLLELFSKFFPEQSGFSAMMAALIIEKHIICGNSLEIMKKMEGDL